ncbi:hypothetical protein SAMN03159358_2909 [Paenibacillus sp. NFR01]|nr:hypothetical protein SAMN03159358_2909 [Paenibacillus sp. NFR01]
MPIRIRIIGGCGSGKSYIARALSDQYGIPHYETDNMVWDRSAAARRYPEEERDARLRGIAASASWIIEGVHHRWGAESFAAADVIYILNPPKWRRNWRTIRRFARTRLGLERANYRQTWGNLRVMLLEWNRDFDAKALPEIMKLTEPFAGKRVIVRSSAAILQHAAQWYAATARETAEKEQP